MRINFKCILCKQEIEDGYPNNPYPYFKKGYACDSCNVRKVIPHRVKLALSHIEKEK